MDDDYEFDDLDVLTSLLGDEGENHYDVKPDITKLKPQKNEKAKNDSPKFCQAEESEWKSSKQSCGSSDEDKSKAELIEEMEKMKERMRQLASQIQMKDVSSEKKQVESFSEAMDAEVAKRNEAKKKSKVMNNLKKRRIENERITKLSGLTSEDLFGCEEDDDWNLEDSDHNDDEEPSFNGESTTEEEGCQVNQSVNTQTNLLFNKNKKRKAHSPNTDTVLQEKTSPYKCRLCDMQFNDFDSFNVHQFKHRKEHPYECKKCDKVFACKLLLHSHLRIHEGSENRTPNTSSKQSKLKDYYQTDVNSEVNVNNKRPSLADSSTPKGHMAVKKRKIEDEQFETNGFSQIRIVNPLVSSSSFKQYVGDRKFLRMSIMKSFLSGGEIEGNWVTSGVIISKTPPKTSSKGKVFSIWKLSDLRDCSVTVGLFLFGKVHEEHWKTKEGSVVGVLNASVLPQRDQSNDEISITVDNYQKLLILGKSKDFGFCKAKKKNGQPCGNFVNKQSCEYCKFHVQKQYQKMMKRSDLQSSYAGVQPKANWKGLNKEQFMYGGKSYNLNSRGTMMKNNSQNKLTLKSLGAKDAEKFKQESLKNVLVMHSKASDEKDTLVQVGGVSTEFKDLLNAPTPGAQNVLRHLISAEKDKDPVISVSAKDLLKQHNIDMKKRIADRKQHRRISGTENGCIIDLGSPNQFYGTSKETSMEKVPKLGRGFKVDTSGKVKTPYSLEEAKRQAVAMLRAKGEITKVNPNKLYKGPISEKAKQNVRQKVEESTKFVEDKEDDMIESSQPKKRIILGQEVELSKDDIEKIAKTKSVNADLFSQFELEMQEQYFNKMEIKEGMERMMDSIKEKEVNIVSCKQCKYTWFKASELCKKENHQLTWHAGKQRFFTCKDCKTRCITFNRIPNKSCRNCKGTNFERVSMLKEKRGPLLDSEKLLLRGEERKWVKS